MVIASLAAGHAGMTPPHDKHPLLRDACAGASWQDTESPHAEVALWTSDADFTTKGDFLPRSVADFAVKYVRPMAKAALLERSWSTKPGSVMQKV